MSNPLKASKPTPEALEETQEPEEDPLRGFKELVVSESEKLLQRKEKTPEKVLTPKTKEPQKVLVKPAEDKENVTEPSEKLKPEETSRTGTAEFHLNSSIFTMSSCNSRTFHLQTVDERPSLRHDSVSAPINYLLCTNFNSSPLLTTILDSCKEMEALGVQQTSRPPDKGTACRSR